MRVGLFAMSGVRACDPELLELGLTLPGFVERSEVIASLPSLGLLTLAGIQRDEHEYAYFEVSDIREMESLPTGLDLVAISSFSAQINEGYELADRYRALGVPVVIGGLHATSCSDEALEHADAVVVGEGEPVWPRVLADTQAGTLGGVYETEEEFDLSLAPMPAFDLLDIEKYNRLTVQISRGCPHKCEFCASSILLTNSYKVKPVDKVLAEIDYIQSIWDRPFIEFADDNAFIRRAESKQLLRELTKRRVRWFAETDISIAKDLELLELMQRSGCYEVLIGLESPVPNGLSGLELNADWKAKQWAGYIDAIRTIQGAGIRVNGCFIVGLDGHTSDIFDAVWEFSEEAELFDIQITYPTVFPGTPFHDRLRAEGRLDADDWRRCTLFDIQFDPVGMSREELRDGFMSLGQRLYNQRETRRRRRRFHFKYARRPSRKEAS